MLSLSTLKQSYYEAHDERLKLLNDVNDYTIYTHFIGREIKCGEFINSPIRYDETPSFNIYYPRHQKWDGQMLFKDYSGPSGNVFQFVHHWAKYNENISLNTNKEIVMYIKEKLSLETELKPYIVASPEKLDAKVYNISILPRFSSKHIEYLSELGIDPDFARDIYKVYPCEYLMNEYSQVIHDFRGTVTFAYVIFDKFKLYQPNVENFIKFFNHCPSDYIQGYEQCRMDVKDVLIITKSMKDILVIQSHTDRWYDIISPHGEGYNIPEHWINWYLQYDRIVIMYDPDEAGIKGANRLRKAIKRNSLYRGQQVDVRFIWNAPRILKKGKYIVPIKDTADYRYLYGGERTRKQLKTLLDG